MSRTRWPVADVLIFLLLSAVWGTTWAAIRIALEGIPPLGGVAVRFALAGLLLLFYAWVGRVPLGRSPVERRLWLIQVGTTFAGSYTVVYWAEQWVPSALAAIIFATFPVWALLLGRLLLPAGAVRSRELLGGVAGFVGILVLFAEDLEGVAGAGAKRAALLLLLAPILSAFGSVAAKRWGSGIPALSLTAVPMLLTGGVVGALSFALEDRDLWSWELAPWLATLYLALAGSALTFVLYFRLLERRSLFVASALAFTIPVVALGVGVVFMGEPWSSQLGVGAALILAGVGLGSWGSANSPPADPTGGGDTDAAMR